jgi:hypothetical protein
MDNLGSFSSLDEYFHGSCPPADHPVFTKLRKCLEKFWRITGGYHGDLNPSNIAVIHENGVVKKVRLIDYGSHKKFKTTINEKTCFNDFIKIIDKEFYTKYVRASNRGYFPQSSKIKIVYPKRGQPIRPNTNMLRGITPNSKAAVRPSQSIMNKINPMNDNTKIKNFFNRRRYITEGRLTNNNIKRQLQNIGPAHHFLSPRVFNKIVKGDPLRSLKNEMEKSFNQISFPKLKNIVEKIPKNKRNETLNYLSKVPNNKKKVAAVVKYFV